MIKEATPELNASSSEAEEEKDEIPKVDGEKDPDFSQVSPFTHWSYRNPSYWGCPRNSTRLQEHGSRANAVCGVEPDYI